MLQIPICGPKKITGFSDPTPEIFHRTLYLTWCLFEISRRIKGVEILKGATGKLQRNGLAAKLGLNT